MSLWVFPCCLSQKYLIYYAYLFIYLFIRVLMQFVSVGNIGSAANLS